jgi:hypothetical protein
VVDSMLWLSMTWTNVSIPHYLIPTSADQLFSLKPRKSVHSVGVRGSKSQLEEEYLYLHLEILCSVCFPNYFALACSKKQQVVSNAS